MSLTSMLGWLWAPTVLVAASGWQPGRCSQEWLTALLSLVDRHLSHWSHSSISNSINLVLFLFPLSPAYFPENSLCLRKLFEACQELAQSYLLLAEGQRWAVDPCYFHQVQLGVLLHRPGQHCPLELSVMTGMFSALPERSHM